jgi:hypothetical protein
MIADQPAAALQPSRPEPSDRREPISLNRIVGVLQIVLAARRAAPATDDEQYWYTVARGM